MTEMISFFNYKLSNVAVFTVFTCGLFKIYQVTISFHNSLHGRVAGNSVTSVRVYQELVGTS